MRSKHKVTNQPSTWDYYQLASQFKNPIDTLKDWEQSGFLLRQVKSAMSNTIIKTATAVAIVTGMMTLSCWGNWNICPGTRLAAIRSMYYVVFLNTVCQATQTAAGLDSSKKLYLSLLTALGIQHREISRAVNCFCCTQEFSLQPCKDKSIPTSLLSLSSSLTFLATARIHTNINHLEDSANTFGPQETLHRQCLDLPHQLCETVWDRSYLTTCPPHSTQLHTTAASHTEPNPCPRLFITGGKSTCTLPTQTVQTRSLL